ncbi:uncharacterized protein BJ171DRAFT_599135 [Polychytrium aggregatum]|uniref:uncharacterized protein n=1 Tax=Polychytrium aggregatum TaxID=110093 RepID=UPI0022FDCFD7|nr:uncharacterized protein BJ171DRAFT_599135 [Polychytrium aggregatum]KAI9204734.1 hypothetical protein BJ171DRAFT_599135 [Polychytrium aggregatum]
MSVHSSSQPSKSSLSQSSSAFAASKSTHSSSGLSGAKKGSLRARAKNHSWKEKYWDYWLKQPFIDSCVALNKEEGSNFVAIIVVGLEFLQMAAYAFIDIEWGNYGDSFGDFLESLQFEYLFSRFTSQTFAISSLVVAFLFVVLLLFLSVYVIFAFKTGKFFIGIWPIRVLRTCVSILPRIVYVPLLDILLRTHVQGQAMIRSSSSNILGYVFIVLTCISLVILVPFSLVMSLIFLNPNPQNKSILAKPSGRLEVIESFLKTLLVFLTVLLEEYAIVRCAILLLNGVIISLYLFCYLPYYSRIMNILRMIMSMEFIIVSGFGMFQLLQYGHTVFHATTDSSVTGADIVYFVWLSATIVSAVLCYFPFSWYYERRTHYILKRFESDPEDQRIANINTDLAEQIGASLASVNFWSPYEVEIATRFLYGHANPTQLQLKYAELVYCRGLQQFSDTDPVMLIFASIFFGIYMKDVRAWRLYIQKAEKIPCSIDIQLMIAQSSMERKRHTVQQSQMAGEEVDVLDQIDRRNKLRVARRCTSEAVDLIVALWRSLMLDKLDSDGLQKMATRISNKEIKAQKNFEKLLDKHSQDIEVLYYYADFLERVQMEYDRVDQIFKFIAAKQEQLEANNDYVNKVHSEDQLNTQVKKPKKVFLPPRRTITKKEMRAVKKFRSEIFSMKSRGIRLLKVITIGLSAILSAIALGQFVWFNVTTAMLSSSISVIEESGWRREIATLVPIRLRLIQEAYLTGDIATAQYYVNESMANFTTFFNTQEALFFGSDMSTPSYSFWLTPWIRLVYFMNGNVTNSTWINYLSTWDASSEFWRMGREAVGISASSFLSSAHYSNPSWRFVMSNFPYTYANAYDKCTTMMVSDMQNGVQTVILAEWIALGAVGAILLLVGVFVFRPVLDTTFEETELSLQAVLTIPKANMEYCYSKALEMKNMRNACSSEHEVDQLSDEELSGDDADDKGNESSSKVTEARRVVYIKLTCLYAASLVLTFIALTIYVVVTALGSMSVREAGNRVNVGMAIRYISYRVAFFVNELQLNDFYLYPRQSILQGYIQNDLATFNQMQFALLFGDPNLGISQGRLPQAVGDVMFTPTYTISSVNGGYENASVDEMVNIVLNEVTILQETVMVGPNNPSAQRVVELVPNIVDGFMHQVSVTQALFEQSITDLQRQSTILCCMVIFFLIVNYYYSFRKLQKIAEEGEAKCRRLLLMIPPTSATRNRALQTLLLGKSKVDAYFMDLNRLDDAQNPGECRSGALPPTLITPEQPKVQSEPNNAQVMTWVNRIRGSVAGVTGWRRKSNFTGTSASANSSHPETAVRTSSSALDQEPNQSLKLAIANDDEEPELRAEPRTEPPTNPNASRRSVIMKSYQAESAGVSKGSPGDSLRGSLRTSIRDSARDSDSVLGRDSVIRAASAVWLKKLRNSVTLRSPRPPAEEPEANRNPFEDELEQTAEYAERLSRMSQAGSRPNEAVLQILQPIEQESRSHSDTQISEESLQGLHNDSQCLSPGSHRSPSPATSSASASAPSLIKYDAVLTAADAHDNQAEADPNDMHDFEEKSHPNEPFGNQYQFPRVRSMEMLGAPKPDVEQTRNSEVVSSPTHHHPPTSVKLPGKSALKNRSVTSSTFMSRDVTSSDLKIAKEGSSRVKFDFKPSETTE